VLRGGESLFHGSIRTPRIDGKSLDDNPRLLRGIPALRIDTECRDAVPGRGRELRPAGVDGDRPRAVPRRPAASNLDREPFNAARICRKVKQLLSDETLRFVNRQVVALGRARPEAPDGSAEAKADSFVGRTDARFPTSRGLACSRIPSG